MYDSDGDFLKVEDFKHCPYCGQKPVDLTQYMDFKILEVYAMANSYPVGCVNIDCDTQCRGNSLGWNKMVESIKHCKIVSENGTFEFN